MGSNKNDQQLKKQSLDLYPIIYANLFTAQAIKSAAIGLSSIKYANLVGERVYPTKCCSSIDNRISAYKQINSEFIMWMC